MKTLIQKRAPKIISYESIKNLPGKAHRRKNDESTFAFRFIKSYLGQLESLHRKSTKASVACAMELPVNGFGVADFVTIAWDETRSSKKSYKNNSELFIKTAKPILRAFEFKLANWRRALMQASRYKFFSNVSIVVLPIEKCASPLRYLDTFKKVLIGLWGFDKDSNKIICFYSPKQSKPIDSKHYLLAVKLISEVSKTLPTF